MIMKFMDWCHEQGPAGMIIFIVVGTLMCCTGALFGVLLVDVLTDK